MVFAVALLSSLAIHLPVYEVLGVLRDRLFAESDARRRSQPIEFELTSAALPEHIPTPAEPEATDELLDIEEKLPEQAPLKRTSRPKPLVEEDVVKPAPKPRPKPPEPEREQAVAATPKPPAPTPPPPMNSRQAVIQRSADPNVEPPPDARYLAEQNQVVEEETAATVTNMQEDSAETSLGAPRNSPDQQAGNASETDLADTNDVEGDDQRIATPQESQTPTPDTSQPSAGTQLAEAHPQSSAAASTETQPEVTAREAGDPSAGGEPEMMVINDGFGTIRIRRPRPVGSGDGSQGGQHRAGERAQARGAQRGYQGSTGRSSLNLTWSQYEEAFGSEQLREQRESYAEQRRSKTRGGHSEREWTQFRSAIENFLPSVRPGNQTALNAAAAPFATYLVMMHERIHREFAFKFLQGLGLVSGPFSDESLFTNLEIVVNRNGSIHRIGVVKPSGFLPFDFGAFNAVMRAQPYPEAPPSILSGDGRVYLHWGFYRGNRACGTFNASPFILPNPPGGPGPVQDPLRDMVPPSTPPSAPSEVPPDGTYGLNTYHHDHDIHHAHD